MLYSTSMCTDRPAARPPAYETPCRRSTAPHVKVALNIDALLNFNALLNFSAQLHLNALLHLDVQHECSTALACSDLCVPINHELFPPKAVFHEYVVS